MRHHPRHQVGLQGKHRREQGGNLAGLALLQAGHHHRQVGGKIPLAFVLGHFDGEPIRGGRGPRPLLDAPVKAGVDPFFEQ